MIIDIFAGPGGWSEGLRTLDPNLHAMEVGVEWDNDAVATRTFAGHRTIHADVAKVHLGMFRDVTGLIASPPCQDFSSAGAKRGIKGTRGKLVNEPLRWVEELRPEWVAFEQVPLVQPIWHDHAAVLAGLGYSTWVGLLNAADFGVPQSRRRAILIASRAREVSAPLPTHAKAPAANLFGEELLPWVSMSQALGWGTKGTGTVNTGQDFQIAGDRGTAYCFDPFARPAGTITSQTKSWKVTVASDAIVLDKQNPTAADALKLQSFRDGYPFQGTKSKRFEQIGNAIPPTLAVHVLAAVMGVDSCP